MNYGSLRLGAALFATAATFVAAPAWAQTGTFALPAQAATTGIPEFARQAGVQILVSERIVRGKHTAEVRGVYPIEQALRLLLVGTGLEIATNDGRTITLRAGVAAPQVEGSDASGPSSVDELIVTANRRAQTVLDVPMSISAVAGADIERQGLKTILDLGRSVPGLSVVESGPGQNRIFIRGVANGNSSTSLVGVYVDEMPVTGASLGQLDLQLLDLQRVEVLRGPQGTLYGQGSAGGAVRFITNAPDLTQVSGRVSASVYGVRRGDVSEEVTGVLNLPLVEGQLGLRVSGILAEVGGWIDQPAAGRKDINNQSLRNVRARAAWRPSDKLKVDATFVIHRNHGDGITAGADANGDVFFPNGDPLARERLTDNYELYNLTASYDLPGVNVLSSTSYTRSHKLAAGIALKIGTFESFNTDRQDNEVFTQELRFSSTTQGPLHWVAGVFYDDETLDRELVLKTYDSGVSTGLTPIPTKDASRSWSIYGDASYALTPRLEVGAGVRYFQDDRGQISPGVDVDDTFHSTDPRVYASYALTPKIKVYANVAKGFRSGGFSGDVGGVPFDPETVVSYEAGVKGSVGPLRWEAAAFYSEYQDMQLYSLTDTFVGALVNAGDAEIRGVDAQLTYEPIQGLTLQASGNVTKTELVNVKASSQSNRNGDRVDFVPDYAFALSAEYRFDWADGRPGFARLDYNQIGKATLTDYSSGIDNFKTDTLGFMNARLGVTFGAMRAELFGRNLLDESGKQDALAAFGFGSRPKPRVIGVEFGAAF